MTCNPDAFGMYVLYAVMFCFFCLPILTACIIAIINAAKKPQK